MNSALLPIEKIELCKISNQLLLRSVLSSNLITWNIQNLCSICIGIKIYFRFCGPDIKKKQKASGLRLFYGEGKQFALSYAIFHWMFMKRFNGFTAAATLRRRDYYFPSIFVALGTRGVVEIGTRMNKHLCCNFLLFVNSCVIFVPVSFVSKLLNFLSFRSQFIQCSVLIR